MSGKTGKAKAQMIQEALRGSEDRIFWVKVQSAFATGSGEIAEETELWDSTVSDGSENESR